MNLVEDTVKLAVEFIKSIKPGSKVAIVHGHDNDSICSATIIYKLLKNFYKIEPRLIVSDLNFAITENVLNTIRKTKPNYLISVDIAEVNVNILTQLRNISDVMIIDHHTPRGYVKITYVNPRIYDKEIYIPATYLCYKIYGKFLDDREILWIAGIGTLSDMGMKNCNDLFESIKLNYEELVGDNENIDEVLFDNSLLGKLAKIFDSGRVVKGVDGSVIALNALIKSRSYQEILEGKSSDANKLLECYNLSEKEFDRLVKDFEKKKKRIKNLLLYEVKSKYNMKSPLATHLAKKMKNEVLVIYQKSGRYIDVSFRRGMSSGVNLSDLANDSLRNISDSHSGGHSVAAGARFPARYLKKFLNNLMGRGVT